MTWSLDTRRTLALAASSIDERLVLVPLAAPAGDEALAERRWKEWMESATAGDPGSFAHALDAERIDATAARRALGIVEYPAGRPLPAWIDDAAWLIAAACAGSATTAAAGEPQPFDVLFRPMDDAMAARVMAAHDGACSAEARVALARFFAS